MDYQAGTIGASEPIEMVLGNGDGDTPTVTLLDALDKGRSGWTAERKANELIAVSRRLDFDVRLRDETHTNNAEGRRPSRASGGPDVELVDRKTPTQAMRLMMVYVANICGYSASSKAKRNAIAEAACRIVSYDHGLKKSQFGTKMDGWASWVEKAVWSEEKTTTGNVLADRQKGPAQGKYIERVERDFPGYLHRMYRAAVKEVTAEATWGEIAKEMNNKSRQQEGHLDLEMSPYMLRDWFKKHKGKVRKSIDRPIITPERKIERVKWCTDRKAQIASDLPFYAVFLDEKWFYTRSRRKKSKWLPLGSLENPGADILPTLRTVSRRFAAKVSPN